MSIPCPSIKCEHNDYNENANIGVCINPERRCKEFVAACESCHVRGSIYRNGDKFLNDGSGRMKLYAKNHTLPLVQRVPIEDQQFNDWLEWDPEEDYMRG